MHEGGSERDAVSAARDATRAAGGSAEAQGAAAVAARQEADSRHRGHYEGVDESARKPAGGRRRGSLVQDATSVGAATAASGGTPREAGETARRQALRGGASEAGEGAGGGLMVADPKKNRKQLNMHMLRFTEKRDSRIKECLKKIAAVTTL